ncbi:FCD domain-containing protein [Mycolicibacterium thermoresistibile]|jgi:DNA-binding FadR family transcriptional regulator|uniref:FadR/GntR family transcriptional regulator n=1 Tax=Mycolicibacterium hassiacum TaxID=46351 RepID=UPI0023F7AD08|nr:FCD domain-containing protein [Mycolicibacterium hassiacum]MBX5485458.1 FadR family transcriptional regulator [Mycolicibacterium hassiacum]
MTSSPGRQNRQPSKHLAQAIVSQLVADIRASGWVDGMNLGSEAELMQRFGVGRNVLREATRILQQQGIARMQMGRGGGLVVTSPEATSTAHAIEMYLASRNVSSQHVLEAKREVELTCVRLAARRTNELWANRLRKAVALERETPSEKVREIGPNNVHIIIAEMTGNPALILFIEALIHLSATYVAQEAAEMRAHNTYAAHARIAEAVARGDEEAAVREMAAHLDQVAAEILGTDPDVK